MRCVGAIGDAVAQTDRRCGPPHQLPNILSLLPDDEARDELRSFLDSDIAPVDLRDAVMRAYPDLPYHPSSTWFTWIREWRREGRRF